MSQIRIAGVVSDSIVDGPGVRYAIFTQGCPHNCEGCHNIHTHDYKGGSLIDIDAIVADIESLKYIKGVTLSGGEPFVQEDAIIELMQKLKAKGLHILAFSGYTYEELLSHPKKSKALKLVDTLIDGKFDVKLKSLSLNFRGSSNQRMINVQESLAQNKIILVDES